MAYVVSARKYRPQRFEDVVGQQHITSTIKNALLNDKLAHAFLFCGPRGVGKTTCARLLAKVINMDDPKASLEDGSYADTDIDISLNIFELDAASNNTVDNIRNLTEQVRIPPVRGKYKVFIIDEVHMLSTAAFNAFLKTLEEPPPYAKFILATTERHKILPTILSRCQLYDFRRIQVPDMIAQLEKVSASENIKSDYDALYMIAEKADGAMRDALSIFDRIASASSGTVSVKEVVDNLNILDFDYFFRAIDHILQEDAAGLMLLHEEVLTKGFEGDIFINGLAGHLRYLLYCKEEPTQQMLRMSATLKDRYIEQAKAISYGTIMTALNLANQCDVVYPKAKDKRLHVEISLLKICFAERQAYPKQQRSAAPAEKKTLEESESKPSTQPPVAVSSSPSPSNQTVSAPASAPEVVTPTPVEPVSTSAPTPPISTPSISAIPPKVVPQETPKPSSQAAPDATAASSILNTPKLSSLDDLIASVESDLANSDNRRKEITLPEAQQQWDEYSQTVESPTLKSVLSNVRSWALRSLKNLL